MPLQRNKVSKYLRDGNGADAAGDGGEERGFVCTGGVGVPYYFALPTGRQAPIHTRTGVEDRNTILHHIRLQDTSYAGAKYHNIRIARYGPYVITFVSNSYFSTQLFKKYCRWLPH